MRFSKGVIGFEYLPVSIFNLWKLLETIKNNINHSNLEKLSVGDKFIWLLNSESKDTLICMCDFLLKSHCFG
jgi:hypothetical protein